MLLELPAEIGRQSVGDVGPPTLSGVGGEQHATGRKVDVLYAHLPERPGLPIGTPVRAGQIIGRQGGTGRVRSADGTIASIDFLEPRPPGSRDMTPYRDFQRLRRRIAQQLGG